VREMLGIVALAGSCCGEPKESESRARFLALLDAPRCDRQHQVSPSYSSRRIETRLLRADSGVAPKRLSDQRVRKLS
jgi:hypothetical protein